MDQLTLQDKRGKAAASEEGKPNKEAKIKKIAETQ